MKFSTIKTGDLLWNHKMTGAFFVVLKGDGGAFVVNLLLKDSPAPLWVILPRDDDDWVIDDKNHKLSDDEREMIASRMLLWEALNG